MPRRLKENSAPDAPDLWQFERQAIAAGAKRVAGVDEAGRGPLAGPVVAAAVILPNDFDLTDINDSKKMTAAARERSFARLHRDEAVLIGIGIAEPEEIDSINILRATHQAMRRAVAVLGDLDAVFVDGLPVPYLHLRCRALVQGDSRSASIAAASIIAKVTRDRLMSGIYHATYPDYGFARHKGYGTRDHLDALRRHGPCPIHRRSFDPVGQCALRFDDLPLRHE